MNFPKVTCSICNQEVSKRSTVSLQPLTGEAGRGCRTHPEVSGALDEKKMEATLKFEAAEMKREEEIRAAALCLRTLNIVFELPMDRAVMHSRTMIGIPGKILSEARKRVEVMNPEPSPDEELALALATIALVSFGV